jgi:hypothetical protein
MKIMIQNMGKKMELSLMVMAAFMGMLMMFCIMNVLVLMHLSIVIMSVDMLFCGVATHGLSPPIFHA